MRITQVEQRAGLRDRQVDGRALDDLIEVHVAAEAAAVAGRHRRKTEAWRHRDTAEHRPAMESTTRPDEARRWKGQAALAIQPPADRLSERVRLCRQRQALRASHQRIKAVGVIAVGTQAVQGDGKDVAGFGAIDVERADLRIAEQRTGDAVCQAPESSVRVRTVSPGQSSSTGARCALNSLA